MKPNRPVRVCIPICEATLGKLEQAGLKATKNADVIELRLDCLAANEIADLTSIATVLKNLPMPLILTFRPSEQGGYRELTAEQRKLFWSNAHEASKHIFQDVELDLIASLPQLDWAQTIVSHHDFGCVPADLEQLYEQMVASPAHILKIAVHANDVTDCIPIFHLLDKSQSDGRELIAIAMGEAGLATRVLGPSRGSYLTYGALEDDLATAPGQVTATALRSLYRIDAIDDQTLVCGLVGQTVAHSVSPHMHNAAFDSQGINGVYLPFAVNDIKSFITRMVHPRTREISWNLLGLSITAPHKVSVMDYLDEIDEVAREIGAVNTVVVTRDRLVGYNTDADGLIEPLRKLYGSLAGARVAIVGAGGAANAAVWALKRDHAVPTVFARDPAKGKSLSERFDISVRALQDATFSNYDILINTTPLGSLGVLQTQSPLALHQLRGLRAVYDLVYNPIETTLLRQAREAECEVLGGLDMLVTQARYQFKFWLDHLPSESIMQTAALNAL